MRAERGFTLIETVVFIVVISIGMVVMARIFAQQLHYSVDPLMRVKALEIAQGTLDEVLSRRFDQRSPLKGLPACNSKQGPSCAGVYSAPDLDNVGDYAGFTKQLEPGYELRVTVTPVQLFELSTENLRLIRVSVAMPDGKILTLSGYRANY